ncbi:MAG: amino acid ABC transporter permease [Nodosilinea sp.]
MTLTRPVASLPPGSAGLTPLAWLRKNLFSSWFNGILTLLLGALLLHSLMRFSQWAWGVAQWGVIPTNLPLFFVGRFPTDQYWRLWLLLTLLTLMAGLTWGVLAHLSSRLFGPGPLVGLAVAALTVIILPIAGDQALLVKLKLLGLLGLLTVTAWLGHGWGQQRPGLGRWLALGWSLMFLVGLWLVIGGLGLPMVASTAWGGLLLTALMSLVSIVLSFPIGVLLALGRQSPLPVIRLLSSFYIEVVRGVPLITVLFIGLIMVPLFLPGNWRLDVVFRTILGLTLFTAAYLAETIRGGLQAIPKGQYEAASSLGLNTPLSLGLIILPQALKISIPAIVGLFISLLQDTTLVSIVGLFDLLGISRSILANPLFIGRYGEVYLFIGVLYWLLCYAMSQGSRYLERQLHTSH